MHILYQQLAEPLSEAPEGVLLDKWYVQPSEPIRAKRALEGLFARVFGNDTVVPIVTLDMWDRQSPDPFFPKRQTPRNDFALQNTIFPETVLLDKWYTQASEPYFPKRTYPGWTVRVLGNDPVVAPPITVCNWYVQGPSPVLRKWVPEGMLVRVLGNDKTPLKRGGLPILQRDPSQDPTMRRFTEIMADIVNSLIASGQLVQTGPATWKIVP